jgi:hypothetical protein
MERDELKRQLEAVVYDRASTSSARIRALEVIARLEMEAKRAYPSADELPPDPMADLDNLVQLKRRRRNRHA